MTAVTWGYCEASLALFLSFFTAMLTDGGFLEARMIPTPMYALNGTQCLRSACTQLCQDPL